MADIGIRLKQLREAKGMSLRELGKFAHLSHSFIADIEAGRSQPSLDALLSLANTLGVSVAELIGDTKANGTQAAHRTDDPMADLPPEAIKSLEEFKEFILRKYGKSKE